MKENVIFTIGRQFGSGGREIGRRLAERLGIPFYDRALLSEAAQRTGLTRDMKSGVDCCERNSTAYPDPARYIRFSRLFSGLATNRFTPSADSARSARELKA